MEVMFGEDLAIQAHLVKFTIDQTGKGKSQLGLAISGNPRNA
ncbi:MAG: hypothetical protein NZP34_16035 [Caldilineales bacterium]|nr:hypothetical protein [Caldilineales bacterium]